VQPDQPVPEKEPHPKEFEVAYDDPTEQETNLPALITSQDQTFCDSCYERRSGPGPYEPE
jgi:hypothetical protein